jgi:hypothetical protein
MIGGATFIVALLTASQDDAANERVTGAAASPDGRWIALRR